MIWSCFKNKSNYLFYYGKSPLPQGCHNPSIIEQQQLWCSAWMIKALAIEILPAMVSAYQGVLHQLTSFSRSYCTSGISGSNVLGVSWQWQYLPFMYPNTFKKRRKKKKYRHPPVNFSYKSQDLLSECFSFEACLNFISKEFSLSIPRNMTTPWCTICLGVASFWESS